MLHSLDGLATLAAEHAFFECLEHVPFLRDWHRRLQRGGTSFGGSACGGKGSAD